MVVVTTQTASAGVDASIQEMVSAIDWDLVRNDLINASVERGGIDNTTEVEFEDEDIENNEDKIETTALPPTPVGFQKTTHPC